MRNAISVRFIHNVTFSTAIKAIRLDKKIPPINKQVTLHEDNLEVGLSNGINSELGLD